MSKRQLSWMNPKLEIRKSNKHGKGIFAKLDTRKGEILFVISGHILSVEDDNHLGEVAINHEIDISPDFSIGIIDNKQKAKMPHFYINHSCNPNAGFNGQLIIAAMRKITGGEEVTYDYATAMYRNNKSRRIYNMECNCGSKYCRRLITEIDWKLADLQKRYNGYFQPFIQAKIDKLRKKR